MESGSSEQQQKRNIEREKRPCSSAIHQDHDKLVMMSLRAGFFSLFEQRYKKGFFYYRLRVWLKVSPEKPFFIIPSFYFFHGAVILFGKKWQVGPASKKSTKRSGAGPFSKLRVKS